MALQHLEALCTAALENLRQEGRLKGQEHVITAVCPPRDGFGPRYLLHGYGERPFLRMNANAYLGFNTDPRVIAAAEEAARRFGTGPGAVRFISGTFQPHIALEQRLAAFHARPACMLFSAAYAAVLGIVPLLMTEQTLVLSDALNHNCIINAMRLAQPAAKAVYRHLDTAHIHTLLEQYRGQARRVLLVTDGVFSMRGDMAPLGDIVEVCERHQSAYEEGIITVVDDSHGVGACGAHGRGTEEQTGARADILIGTLGKALGVNGGYVVSSQTLIAYCREMAPLYIYSNPLTPAEAAAALQALRLLDSDEGVARLRAVQAVAAQLRTGLQRLGYETLPGVHPIVPVLVRHTARTRALVQHLFAHNILATGLAYPVVPQGDEEIRLQLSATHTARDVDYVLEVLHGWRL
ncbi:MAG: aminotransferase class I/II-fold pyridoxal phosphate-dependent enzyme [Candidatus Tectimicrobiota bacterium]